MATVQTAMLGQLPFTVLRDALFTHPKRLKDSQCYWLMSAR
jgi:hypothetical protein